MKVLLVPSDLDQVQEASSLLCSRLKAAGVDAEIQPPDEAAHPVVDLDQIALLVPMGGDGTFLHSVHLVDFAPIPVLGLNHGTLGFLGGSSERDEVDLVTDALAGDLHFEHRATIEATIDCDDGSSHEVTALNELAYTRGASGHIVECSYAVNGFHIADLRADGLIVSTATGSTGYALSAGGPILSPAYDGFVVLPLAPHALTTRAMVLAPSDVLEAEFSGRHMLETSFFVDGSTLDCEAPVHALYRRGSHEVLMASDGTDFFNNVSGVFFGGKED